MMGTHEELEWTQFCGTHRVRFSESICGFVYTSGRSAPVVPRNDPNETDWVWRIDYSPGDDPQGVELESGVGGSWEDAKAAVIGAARGRGLIDHEWLRKKGRRE